MELFSSSFILVLFYSLHGITMKKSTTAKPNYDDFEERFCFRNNTVYILYNLYGLSLNPLRLDSKLVTWEYVLIWGVVDMTKLGKPRAERHGCS